MKAYLASLIGVEFSGSGVLQWLLILSLGSSIHLWLNRYCLHQEPKKAIEFSGKFLPSNQVNAFGISVQSYAGLYGHFGLLRAK